MNRPRKTTGHMARKSTGSVRKRVVPTPARTPAAIPVLQRPVPNPKNLPPVTPTPPKLGKHRPRGILFLHEDRDLLVVDKAPGLLTMATSKQNIDTAYFRLTDFVRKGNPKSHKRIYIVHRLDREVSGILVFAKSVAAKEALQASWEETEKHYLALVQGAPPEKEGILSGYLTEHGVNNVTIDDTSTEGKLSHIGYRVLGQANGVSLLEVHLLTGRKHQIRVLLSSNGLPILGDKKYGVRAGNKHAKFPRLALHAYSLAFAHPFNGAPCHFETRIPHLFAKYMPKDPKTTDSPQ